MDHGSVGPVLSNLCSGNKGGLETIIELVLSPRTAKSRHKIIPPDESGVLILVLRKQKQADFCERGLPGLHSEFQGSQGQSQNK